MLGIVMMMVSDLSIAFSYEIDGHYWDAMRFSRPVRALMICVHFKPIQTEMTKLLSTVPKMLDIGMIITFFLVLFSLIFRQLLQGQETDGLFPRFLVSMRTLLVFSYSDNHSDVISIVQSDLIMPTLFFVCWFVTGLIVLSYATAITFDEYIGAHRSLITGRRVTARTAVYAAMTMMTAMPKMKDCVATLNLEEWKELYALLFEHEDEESRGRRAALIFNLLDADCSEIPSDTSHQMYFWYLNLLRVTLVLLLF